MAEAEVIARFEAARAIAAEAGALLRSLFKARKAGTFSLKGSQDYLTEADGEVERLIARRVAEQFPEDTFFGEEHGGTFGTRTWIVDPIDGTANFARGKPHFCTSIALIEGKTIQVGIIHDPIMEEQFAACRGLGATLNGEPIRINRPAGMREAAIELGWSFRRPIDQYTEMVSRVMAAGAGISSSGSGALALAYVAAGRIDGYAEKHINAWDALAGILLVEEAGGWVNDFLAGDGLRKGNPLLACSPGLKDALQAATGIAG
jgi:myo-inositol-1(or 4)-monophosphatase